MATVTAGITQLANTMAVVMCRRCMTDVMVIAADTTNIPEVIVIQSVAGTITEMPEGIMDIKNIITIAIIVTRSRPIA